MVQSDIIRTRLAALEDYLDLLRARRAVPLADLLGDVREYHATLYELQYVSVYLFQTGPTEDQP